MLDKYLILISASADKPLDVGTISLFAGIILIFILLFAHQSIVVEIAEKKGYGKFRAAWIGLLPVFGIIYFLRLPKIRNITDQSIKNSMRVKNWLIKLGIYLEIVLLCILVLVPIIYLIGSSLSGVQSDLASDIWPKKLNFSGYERLFKGFFWTWYGNTLIIALINMVIGTVLITGAAYVFARFNFRGKKAGLMTILVLQSFPSFMGLIAMYVLFSKFELLGQPNALTILYIGGSIPGNLWLIKGFLQNIPKDLDESAMIDGANKMQIFFKIILPLAVPILGFVAVGMFMAPWMDYMLPNFLLDIDLQKGVGYDVRQQWTLAVGLFKFISDPNATDYAAFAAGALIIGIPITVLYVAFQRFLIEGIMSGATKG